MKEKEPESYIEKERKHRDRTKKRRLTAEETVEAPKPRMEPYRRKKNWMQLPMSDDDDYDSTLIECPIHQEFYEDNEFGCPYCGTI